MLDSGKGDHSVFTYRLLEQLEAVEGYATTSMIYTQLAPAVARDAKELTHGSLVQTPVFGPVSEGEGDFLWIPLPEEELVAPPTLAEELSAAIGSPGEDCSLPWPAERSDEVLAKLATSEQTAASSEAARDSEAAWQRGLRSLLEDGGCI